MSAASQRCAYDAALLIAPLPNGAGVGQNLRYEGIYDAIKEARRADDVTLSQGIWQTDLKKADWFNVEALCVTALSEKTKDYQILAWLAEAWVMLEGFSGLTEALKITAQLSELFWDILYPQPEENDVENRLRIFDWLNETIGDRLLFVPLTAQTYESDPLTLADWNAAVNLDMVAKRSTDGKAFLAQAEGQGKATLQKFRKALKQSALTVLDPIYNDICDTRVALKAFVDFLSVKLGVSAPTFSKMRIALDDMVRILKTEVESKRQERALQAEQSNPVEDVASIESLLQEEASVQEKSPATTADDDTLTVTGRKEAYMALRDLGSFLKTLDPHSPVPTLIELMAGWEDKTLVDILASLSKAEDGASQLLRVLGNAVKSS